MLKVISVSIFLVLVFDLCQSSKNQKNFELFKKMLCGDEHEEWYPLLMPCISIYDTTEMTEIAKPCYGDYDRGANNTDRYIKYTCDHEPSENLELVRCFNEKLSDSGKSEDWKERILASAECHDAVVEKYNNKHRESNKDN